VWKKEVDKSFPSGFPIQDRTGTVYRYNFDLDVRDDASDLATHSAAVEDLITNANVDVIANVQPAFAVEESIAANDRDRLNLHGATSNDVVFARGVCVCVCVCLRNGTFLPVCKYSMQ